MTFSNFERAVLSLLECDARASSEQVARRLHTKTERVTRARQRMIESQRIVPRAFLNTMGLGYIDVRLFFSLSSCSEAKRKNLLQALAREDGMSWIGAYAGDYRYGLTYLCRHPLELNDLLDRLGAEHPDLFSAKMMLIRSNYTMLQTNLGLSWAGQRQEIVAQCSTRRSAIDALDHKILRKLGSGPLVSLRELARSLGEVSTTVSRRVSQLETNGAIAGYYYAFDPAELGLEIYRLLLDFSSLTPARRAGIYAFARKHPYSVYVIESLGIWDFELGFEVPRAKHMNQIVDDLYAACGTTLVDVKILTELEELHLNFFPFKRAVV